MAKQCYWVLAQFQGKIPRKKLQHHIIRNKCGRSIVKMIGIFVDQGKSEKKKNKLYEKKKPSKGGPL